MSSKADPAKKAKVLRLTIGTLFVLYHVAAVAGVKFHTKFLGIEAAFGFSLTHSKKGNSVADART
jgi:hypothetical protein